MKRFLILLALLAAAAAHGQDNPNGPGPGEGQGATLELGGITFVWCPAGSFEAGSTEAPEKLAEYLGGSPEWYTDEHPARKVDIPAGFWISRTEITRAQWVAVTNERPWEGTPAPSDDVPATGMTWEKANAFTLAFGQKNNCAARLPSEAEWEYAAKAGATGRFPWGDDASALHLHAQCRLNTENGAPRPVGERGPNDWGIHDMLGNVWEWCQDKYTRPQDSRPNPSGSGFRIIKGGAANSTAAQLRPAFRTALPMDAVSPRIGVRLVVEP